MPPKLSSKFNDLTEEINHTLETLVKNIKDFEDSAKGGQLEVVWLF